MAEKKQYYQFIGSESFPHQTIFERDGDKFSPIMGAWTEEGFKKRSGGQGFDKIIKLNTTFEDTMRVNPYYKQDGVIVPEDSKFEIYGTPKARHFDKLSDIFNRITPTKKYKFDFTDDHTKTLAGERIIGNYETNSKYKDAIKIKNVMSGGASGDMGDHYEIKINPNLPENEVVNIIAHEIGHSLFKKISTPDYLFRTNRTRGHYQSFQDMGKTTIDKNETIADHFSDYINYNEEYRLRYPDEAKFFDNYLK